MTALFSLKSQNIWSRHQLLQFNFDSTGLRAKFKCSTIALSAYLKVISKVQLFLRIQELPGFVENLGSQLEPDAGEVDI